MCVSAHFARCAYFDRGEGVVVCCKYLWSLLPTRKANLASNIKQRLSGIGGEDGIGMSPVKGGVLFKGEPLVYLS